MPVEELRPAPAWIRLAAKLTRRMPFARHRVIEGLFSSSNQRFSATMARELGGYTFDCSLHDRVARTVFFAGCHAGQEVAAVRRILKPGMTFVDAGANWGLFTLLAAHLVGSNGHVVALEPDPRIFAKLKSNVERNRLEQVSIFEVAAADRDASLVLAGHDHASDNWEVSRLVEDASAEPFAFTVFARRLDGLLHEAGVATVDLLKMDIEGAEDMALAGMEAGLRGHRYRRIMLELHPGQLNERNHSVDEIVNGLKGRGYRGYALDYTPAGFRRTYYHPWASHSGSLLPLEEGLKMQLRHTLWLAPGEASPG